MALSSIACPQCRTSSVLSDGSSSATGTLLPQIWKDAPFTICVWKNEHGEFSLAYNYMLYTCIMYV